MKTVFKYPIEIADKQTISMPRNAEIVRVGTDPKGTPCVWAVVDSSLPLEPVALLVVGTGHPLPSFTGRYLGSVNTHGQFVWHVFSVA